MAKHWLMLTVAGFVTAGIVFTVTYYIYNRFFVSHRPWAVSMRKRFPLGLFRRLSSGGNVMPKQRQSYELVRRDEEDAL